MEYNSLILKYHYYHVTFCTPTSSILYFPISLKVLLTQNIDDHNKQSKCYEIMKEVSGIKTMHQYLVQEVQQERRCERQDESYKFLNHTAVHLTNCNDFYIHHIDHDEPFEVHHVTVTLYHVLI